MSISTVWVLLKDGALLTVSINTVWVLLLVAAAAWTGRVLQKRYWQQEGWATVALLATFVIVFCFHMLGYAALLTEYPCFTVSWAAGLSLALAILVFVVHKDTVVAMAHSPRLAGWRPEQGAALFVGAGIVLYAILIAGGVIAGPWGWDSTAYHVPAAITWFRIGLPHDPALLKVYGDMHQPFGWERTALYPMNMSLFGLLAIAAGGVRFVAISQAPFALIAAAFVGGIARELGAARVDRRLASLAFLATPIIAFQAITPFADVFAACWFLAATYYLVVLLRASPAGLSVLPLIGLSLGLAVGAKYNAIPYAAMMGGLVVVVVVLRQYNSIRHGGDISRSGSQLVPAVSLPQHHALPSVRRGIGAIGLFLACGVLAASFWYVRNWVVMGSPTYPVGLSVAGKELFPGIEPAGMNPGKQYQFIGGESTSPGLRWLIYPWTNTAISEEDGAGLPLAILLPGAAIVVLARTRRSMAKRRPRDRAYVALLLLTIGAIGIWWNATSREPRFILLLWGFVFAAGASIVSALRRRSIVDLRTVLLGAILVSMLASLGFLRDRATYRSGSLCTYAQKTLVDFIETLPAGSTILNDPSEISSTPCTTILAGKRLQHRVIVGERYFDPNIDPETLYNRFNEYRIDYVLYYRLPGAALRPAYADSTRFPVVYVDDQNEVLWTTVQHVLR